MLRHIRNQQVYWFCRHCWQEMPSSELDYVEAYFRWPTLVGNFQIPVGQTRLNRQLGIAQQVR
jgi:hypothetical protein